MVNEKNKEEAMTLEDKFYEIAGIYNDKYDIVEITADWDNRKEMGALRVCTYDKSLRIYREIFVKGKNGELVFLNRFKDETDLEHEIEIGISLVPKSYKEKFAEKLEKEKLQEKAS